MANEHNLIPFTSDQSHEEAVRNGRKGGTASGAARRAKREARETAKMVLNFKPDIPPQMLATIRNMGLKGKASPDMRVIATMAIMQKAMKGDVKCYEFLVKMAGETSEAQMLDAKAEEVSRRSGFQEERSPELGIDEIRARMDGMSDEELRQYESLCAIFGGGGGEDE